MSLNGVVGLDNGFTETLQAEIDKSASVIAQRETDRASKLKTSIEATKPAALALGGGAKGNEKEGGGGYH